MKINCTGLYLIALKLETLSGDFSACKQGTNIIACVCELAESVQVAVRLRAGILAHVHTSQQHPYQASLSHTCQFYHLCMIENVPLLVLRIQTWLLRSFLSPRRTSSYASSFFPKQLSVSPFIANVSAKNSHT